MVMLTSSSCRERDAVAECGDEHAERAGEQDLGGHVAAEQEQQSPRRAQPAHGVAGLGQQLLGPVDDEASQAAHGEHHDQPDDGHDPREQQQVPGAVEGVAESQVQRHLGEHQQDREEQQLDDEADLSVWVATGDGDALSIGGNHLIHALRRNVNLKILLFNNRIYGLTKGQYSPTSELGKVTKSTPMGSLDWPFNPLSLAIGAEATFVARAIDTDKAGMTAVLRAAAGHRGSAFVEIFQNCPIFNDDAFAFVRDDKEGVNRIPLRDGEPITWGAGGEKALRQRSDGSIEICSAGEDGVLVHDAHHEGAALAFALHARDAGLARRHSGRRLPRRRAAGLRRPHGRAARDGSRKARRGRSRSLLHSGETWNIG